MNLSAFLPRLALRRGHFKLFPLPFEGKGEQLQITQFAEFQQKSTVPVKPAGPVFSFN
jgi:hypothetical protein